MQCMDTELVMPAKASNKQHEFTQMYVGMCLTLNVDLFE